MVTTKQVTDQIKKDLGLVKPKPLSEAYVANPKKYELTTELLSGKAKDAHTELYQGYIEKLNKISARLDSVDRESADSKSSAYHSLKQDETYNRNAVHLHELYFANISDIESEATPDTLAVMRLTRDHGTFDDWQWDFVACGMSSKQGWVVCAYDTFLRRYVNFSIDGDSMNIPVGCYPVIVIDMWEHAWFRDYLGDRELYLMNMMRELNWEVIEARFKRAEMIGKVLEQVK